MRKIVKESGNCVWFLAPSNQYYEEVDINELIDLPINERYVTIKIDIGYTNYFCFTDCQLINIKVE